MKKVLLLMMFPIFALGQYTSIPDSVFEQKLINFGYDSVHDGQVFTANIVNVDSLDLEATFSGGGFGPIVMLNNINDLTGIEDFSNLTYLNCSNNDLTQLDLSQNSMLDLRFS